MERTQADGKQLERSVFVTAGERTAAAHGMLLNRRRNCLERANMSGILLGWIAAQRSKYLRAAIDVDHECFKDALSSQVKGALTKARGPYLVLRRDPRGADLDEQIAQTHKR
jgi:hypothetical protein